MATKTDATERDDPRSEWWAVTHWRQDELERAGWTASEAIYVADRHDIDLHYACELVRRGCPPTTALVILL
jgi:hypothetical protein